MNENDYKNLIAIYQQKAFDLFLQVIALEARLTSSKQLVESLSLQVNDLTIELASLKAKTKKTNIKTADNSEEF